MARINGTNLVVQVDNGNGQGKVACSFSQDCKLSIDLGTANATTKDSGGWDEIIPTNAKWSMDTNGLVDFHPSATVHNVADLFNAMANKLAVTVNFTLVSQTTGDQSWNGTAYITKLEQNAKDKDVVSYSATFEGTAALTMVTH
jgi:predicted secreted protein